MQIFFPFKCPQCKRTEQIIKNVNRRFVSRFKVKSFDVNETFVITLPREDNKELIVTTIEANHCTGSSMFLFETEEKTILYTSDFRYSKDELQQIRALRNPDGSLKCLDALYVDCSFLRHNSYEFPSVQFLIKDLITRIENFKSENNVQNHEVYRRVHIHSDEPEKEGYIINQLAMHFGEAIHVSWNMNKKYKCIPQMDPYLTSSFKARIHMCLDPCYNHELGLRIKLQDAWSESNAGGDEHLKMVEESGQEIIVAHTLHATHEEVKALIQMCKPTKAVPCVIPNDFTKEQAENALRKMQDEISEGAETEHFKFDGFIKGFEGVAADRFDEDQLNSCPAIFLSHCHFDHMRSIENLINTPFENTKLYCTKESLQILRNIRRKLFWSNSSAADRATDRFDSMIEVLELGLKYTIEINFQLRKNSPSEQREVVPNPYTLAVTTIPANHCLGSCMFLFERENNRRVLFTGDFRFYESQLPDIKELHFEDGTAKEMDLVYLDTTFFHQVNKTKDFPTLEKSLEMIKEEIDGALNKDKNTFIQIQQPAYVGSEEIIMEIFTKYNIKIWMHQDSFQYYEGIKEITCCLTTKENESKRNVHICMEREINCKPSATCRLKIIPSALYFAKNLTKQSRIEDGRNIRIALSRHCGHKELVAFLRYFKPKQVIACVAYGDNGYTMGEIQSDLDKLVDEINVGKKVIPRSPGKRFKRADDE
ncbi:protein artemis-like isoform X2 [Neocloeon triangulifer]|uniref:protein artemis-like isoform X2 n=1 Tax=Neocloeon triangulifer TaxID=2078957 RepID=UPI00286F7E44|nr:protein artemis-like isoform X2 [Neocloeon triangulifer]